MSEETRKVLEMVSSGTISVGEAEQLLAALNSTPAGATDESPAPRFFRITVDKPAREGRKADKVNIRVPISVVRGGLRLSSLLPGLMAKKTFQLANGTELDLSTVTYADLEAMIKDIGAVTVDVDGEAQVRIRTE